MQTIKLSDRKGILKINKWFKVFYQSILTQILIKVQSQKNTNGSPVYN